MTDLLCRGCDRVRVPDGRYVCEACVAAGVMRPRAEGMTDAELAAIEARAAAMLASADATERDEPDLAGLAAQIRGHAGELASLVAEVRRLNALVESVGRGGRQ